MPPTVGQYQILEHLESPYLGGGRALASELYTAVLICWAPRWLGLFLVRHPKCLGTCIYFMAAGWAGLLHVVAQPRWLRPISRWLEARVGRRRVEWVDEHQRFFRWMQECTWVPEPFRDENDPKPEAAGIPTSYRMQDGLIGKFTLREVLAMSMPEANLRLLAASANSGRKYETPEEYAKNAYPEGFAYHEEDFPTLVTTISEISRIAVGRKRILDQLSTFGMDENIWTTQQKEARAKLIEQLKDYPAIDVLASHRAAAAADLKKMEETRVN
jgi:hypothetical protein